MMENKLFAKRHLYIYIYFYNFSPFRFYLYINILFVAERFAILTVFPPLEIRNVLIIIEGDFEIAFLLFLLIILFQLIVHLKKK